MMFIRLRWVLSYEVIVLGSSWLFLRLNNVCYCQGRW